MREVEKTEGNRQRVGKVIINSKNKIPQRNCAAKQDKI